MAHIGRLEYGGNIRQILSQVESERFLDFFRWIGIPNTYLEECKKRLDYREDIKFKHVMEGFRKDKRRFVMINQSRLPQEYVEAYRTESEIPNLKPKDVYEFIDNFGGEDWRQVAQEFLDHDISREDSLFGRDILREEHRITLLTQWIQSQRSPEGDMLNELKRLYESYSDQWRQPEKAF